MMDQLGYMLSSDSPSHSRRLQPNIGLSHMQIWPVSLLCCDPSSLRKL